MTYVRKTAILIALLAAVCSCRRSSAVPLPPELVVRADARDLRTPKRKDGIIEVTYRTTEAFPADRLLTQIRAALPPPVWAPLPTDWLNPQVPSSHERGWTDCVDGTGKPKTAVHQWLAQWRDAQGNIVVYELRYDSKFPANGLPVHEPDNHALRVSALWVPKPLADRMMEWTHGMNSGPTPPKTLSEPK